jgi:dethiobiotin synthetase/adenosylmethionine--8-amino-7-oxononanoate aminotransferase
MSQGMTDELHGKLVGETMRGAARYGHVIHANTAIQPTVQLAEMLLSSVGKGWAARVFYSDDG